MSSINKVILIGNLGADPEIRYTAGGDAICNFRLATTETWKDKSSGEKRESTEWHRIVLYRKLAEVANQHLKKGAQVYIEGKLKTRKWQDQQGQDRYSTDVEASEMTMLGSKNLSNNTNPGNEQISHKENFPNKQSGKSNSGAIPAWLDDTIPF